MAQKDAQEIEYDELISWNIPEYERHNRGFRWYLIVGIIMAILAGFSLFTPNWLFDTPNYLFLIIIILSAVTMILLNAMAGDVDFVITTEGIIIGDKFYDFDDFRHFCVLSKPRENLKVLYLEFRGMFKPRLVIPMQDANPLEVRDILLDYLTEDLERTDESNTDFLSRMFKI